MLVNLRAAILERGTRGWKVARKANIPPNRFSAIVHGQYQPSASLRAKIAEVLEADENWLFAPSVEIPPRVGTRSMGTERVCPTKRAITTPGGA